MGVSRRKPPLLTLPSCKKHTKGQAPPYLVQIRGVISIVVGQGALARSGVLAEKGLAR